MGRPRQELDVHGQKQEVNRRYKQSKPGWEKERLLAIKLGLEKQLGMEEIAQTLGRSRATIQSWFERYRQGGIDRLLSKEKGKGFAGALNQEQMRRFAQELEKGQWRTGKQAYQWLQQEFGVSFHPQNIYKYLKKLGGRLKVPRPSHQKKDLQQVVKFKEGLSQKLMDLELPVQRPVRLWIYDEMRYGLQPLTRRMWTTRGTQISAVVNPRYQWGYVFGALQVGGAGAEFLCSPSISKAWDLEFLKQISARDPFAIHVVIGDGAGFHHRNGDPQLPENIRILTLPPYSPELNPVEKLWDVLKDSICNKAYPELEDLQQDITQKLRDYWDNAQNVFSLIGNGYLTGKLNATSSHTIIPV